MPSASSEASIEIYQNHSNSLSSSFEVQPKTLFPFICLDLLAIDFMSINWLFMFSVASLCVKPSCVTVMN